jgi:hypothetical protein
VRYSHWAAMVSSAAPAVEVLPGVSPISPLVAAMVSSAAPAVEGWFYGDLQ